MYWTRLICVTVILFLVGLLLTGCATGDQQLRAQVAGANIDLVKAQAKAYEAPIVELRVPQANGQALEIVLRNPVANVTPVAMPDDPYARALDRAVGVAGTLGGVWLGGVAASGIVKETGKAVVGGLSAVPTVTQPAPIVVEQPAPVVVEPSYPPQTF